MERLILIGALALAAGCGSRTGLSLGFDAPDESPCGSLTLREPVLSIQDEPTTEYDDVLELFESSDDGTQITGVFTRIDAEQSYGIVEHATLFPWTGWPATETLAPVHTTTIETFGDPKAARAPGSKFALATLLEQPTFIPNLAPNASGAGPGPFTKVAGTDVSFVVPGYLVGSSDGASLMGTVVQGAVAKKTMRLGCASVQPARGGAVPYADGWLAAASTGAAFGTCDDPAAPSPGPPTRIDVMRVASDASVSLITSIDAGTPIVDVQTASHPDGLYVIWSQRRKALTESVTIRAARVDAVKGSIVAGPVGVQSSGETSVSFKATAQGDNLAVVRRNDVWGAGAVMTIALFDESLHAEASSVFQSDLVVFGPTSAVGSRDGRSLLVAFTNDGKKPWRVRIARYDCAP